MTLHAWKTFAGRAGIALLLLASGGCEPNSSASKPASPAAVPLSAPFHSAQWNTPLGTGQRITTRHYQIFTTVQDSSLLAVLPGFMEAAYANYQTILPAPTEASPDPMPMYMMSTRAEWEALTINRFGQAGPARVIEDGGYTYQGVTVCWAIGRPATLAVASHEGMHQLLYHSLRNRLALWAEEGLATTAEGFVLDRGTVRFTPDQNLMRLMDLRKNILDGGWMDLRTLLSTDTATIAQTGGQVRAVGYYGQVYAMMQFLRQSETYRPRWQAMFQAAKEGRFREALSQEQLQLQGRQYNRAVAKPLFEHYITNDLDGFDAEFQRYARRLVKLPPLE